MAFECSFCVDEVKKNDYERYLCCLLTNNYVRPRLFPIYALNNELAKIKDVVSEPMMGHIRLQWWRDAIDEIYAGRPVKHKHDVTNSLYDVVCDTDIPKELFDNLIDAREADIEFVAPENLSSLENYAVGTCSNLFYLLMAASGINCKVAREAAYYAGVAYAITGIMRSMKYNAYYNRVMLPKNLMEKQSVRVEDILQGKDLEKTRPIVRALCDKVEVNLHHIKALQGSLGKDAISILLPVSVVGVFLKRIRKNDYDIFNSDLEGGVLGIQLKILLSKLTGRV